jgi:hypothetical protein
VEDLNRLLLQNARLYTIAVLQDLALGRQVEEKGGRSESRINRAIHKSDVRERARAGAEQAVDRASVHDPLSRIQRLPPLIQLVTTDLVLALRRVSVLSFKSFIL